MTAPHSDALSRVLAAYRSPASLGDAPKDTPLLLGLSGGADSRLSLHLVAEECRQNGAPLHLAHVHHGIRGKEADRDEQFCRELANAYGLPLHVLHADIPTLAKERGESVETIARQVRYDYFSHIMEEHGIPLLITAHNADDNLETVLFHLSRGCGLSGLGGIAPVRKLEHEGQTVVRPLLACSKADIIDACHGLELDYVTDSTNADTSYSRNRLRAQVTPALAAITPHPEQQFLRACASLREDEDVLNTLAKDFLARELQNNAVKCASLAAAHPAIAKRALRLWVHSLCGQLPEACHVVAMLRLCTASAVSRRVSIVGNLIALAERETLRILPAEECDQNAPSFVLPLQMGITDYPEFGFRIRLTPWETEEEKSEHHEKNTKNDINVYNPFICDTLTFDTIEGCEIWCQNHRPYLRARREKDTLLYRGVKRKLRKLQNELGVPPSLRSRLPLLCIDDTVLWAPFVGARDGALPPVTKATRHALCLTVEILPRKADHTKEDIL